MSGDPGVRIPGHSGWRRTSRFHSSHGSRSAAVVKKRLPYASHCETPYFETVTAASAGCNRGRPSSVEKSPLQFRLKGKVAKNSP